MGHRKVTETPKLLRFSKLPWYHVHMNMNKEATRTTVSDLRIGDVLGTGETVVNVYRDLRTPSGKRMVIAKRADGSKWGREWRNSTTLTVLR